MSTENPFVPLCNEEDFQTVKRKRNNTDQSEDRVGLFMSSSPDDKLNYIYEELRHIRGSQDQMNRGMFNFQQSFRCVNEKLCEVIEVTNRNTNVLRTLAYKSIDLEARSRRNNLIFWGILENYHENCFHIIREFIKHHLDLDADKMYLARAHRLGPRRIGQRDPRRPIIVNFRDFCDTDLIMNRAHCLKQKPFSIGYDLPKEINEARKKLWDEVKRIKAKTPNAKFQILYPAKLMVEGKIVRDEFPDWGNVIQGNRITDFSHIDSNFLLDQANSQSNSQGMEQFSATCDRACTQVNDVLNGNSNSTRDPLGIHSSGPKDCILETESEMEQELLDSESTTNLPSQASCSPTRNIEPAVSSARDIFRPFDNVIDNNSGRASRTLKRSERRNQSLSIPRVRHASRDKRENPSVAKNKQVDKNNSSETANRQRSVSKSRNESIGAQNGQSATEEKNYADENS